MTRAKSLVTVIVGRSFTYREMRGMEGRSTSTRFHFPTFSSEKMLSWGISLTDQFNVLLVIQIFYTLTQVMCYKINNNNVITIFNILILCHYYVCVMLINFTGLDDYSVASLYLNLCHPHIISDPSRFNCSVD